MRTATAELKAPTRVGSSALLGSVLTNGKGRPICAWCSGDRPNRCSPTLTADDTDHTDKNLRHLRQMSLPSLDALSRPNDQAQAQTLAGHSRLQPQRCVSKQPPNRRV